MAERISILGDSISTLNGFSNNIIDSNYPGNYYPHSGNNVTNFNQTWWGDAINQLGGTIISNDSIGGTCVGYYSTNNYDSLHLGSKWCMDKQLRVSDLGQTNPNSTLSPTRIFFFGGTNDLCQNYTNPIDISNYGNYNNVTFKTHYLHTLQLIYNTYNYNPIVMCITPFKSPLTKQGNDNYTKFNDMCFHIADCVNYFRSFGYDCKLVSLQDIELTVSAGQLDASYHPTASGMHIIADRVAYVCQNS